MPYETGATHITDLVVTNPTASDQLAQADDHLRLIKSILKTDFPNVNAPITATPAILNGIDARVTAVEGAYIKKDGSVAMTGALAMGSQKITGLATPTAATDAVTKAYADGLQPFAAGTKMVFVQAAAPTGWTQDTSQNDRVLRVVSSAGAGVGGSWTISGFTAASHAHGITADGAHTHGIGASGGPFEEGAGAPDYFTNSAGSHSHGGATSAASTNVTNNGSWRPSYQDIIVCTKD